MQLKAEDYDYYDFLIGMDSMNLRNMERMTGHEKSDKMKLLLEYAGINRDVRDPWYTSRFDETYKDVVMGCQAFLDYLREQNMIQE